MGESIRRDITNADTHSPHPPGFGGAGADEDPVEPGFEALRVAQAGQFAPSRHECLLDGVLGGRGVTQDPERQPHQPTADVPHEDLERIGIASLCALYDRDLHDSSLSSPHTNGPALCGLRDGRAQHNL